MAGCATQVTHGFRVVPRQATPEERAAQRAAADELRAQAWQKIDAHKAEIEACFRAADFTSLDEEARFVDLDLARPPKAVDETEAGLAPHGAVKASIAAFRDCLHADGWGLPAPSRALPLQVHFCLRARSMEPPKGALCSLARPLVEDEKTVLAVDAGVPELPRMIGGPPLSYTQRALAENVQGLLIVKCVVEVSGWITGCKVMQGLTPDQDAWTVEILHHRLYSPVLWNGEPVNVDYLFKIKMSLPR